VWAVSRIGNGAMTTSGTDLLQRTLAAMCTVSLSYLCAQILSALLPLHRWKSRAKVLWASRVFSACSGGQYSPHSGSAKVTFRFVVLIGTR
jgi:hypothetical protein